MNDYTSLNHTRWECKYHVVFIPKYRRKAIYGELRKHLGGVLRALAEQGSLELKKGTLWSTMSICCCPSLRSTLYLKLLATSKGRARSTLLGRSWVKQKTSWVSISGHGDIFVSTVGRDEATIREYIRNQELLDKQTDQLTMWPET